MTAAEQIIEMHEAVDSYRARNCVTRERATVTECSCSWVGEDYPQHLIAALEAEGFEIVKQGGRS